MVNVEEIQQLMRELFPRCPICGTDAGYDVSGVFKTYVQCRGCGAKWSNPEFQSLKLENMRLHEPARDGRGSNLLHKKHPVSFWRSLSEEEIKSEYSERYEEALTKGQILVYPEMSDEELLAGIRNDQAEFAWYFNQMTRGKGWDFFHTLFSSGSDLERRQMWMTLAMINQNKVIIRQNEMIIRLLEKMAKLSTSTETIEGVIGD